MHKYANIINE